MKLASSLKKLGIEIWWAVKRHMWVVPLSAIMFGKYVDAIPRQNLISFLEKGCFPYLVFFPFVIVLISILSHICSDSRRVITSNRIATVLLYAMGVLVVLIADWVSISIFALMLFPHAGLIPFKPSAEQLQMFEEYWFGLLIIPAIDWQIFRYTLPKSFGTIKNSKERLSCRLVTAPGKNLIASTLGVLLLIVLFEIMC